MHRSRTCSLFAWVPTWKVNISAVGWCEPANPNVINIISNDAVRSSPYLTDIQLFMLGFAALSPNSD